MANEKGVKKSFWLSLFCTWQRVENENTAHEKFLL